MGKKYTAIYVESWLSGSHWQSLTRMKRIEKRVDERVTEMLENEGILDSVVFLFEGWVTDVMGEV